MPSEGLRRTVMLALVFVIGRATPTPSYPWGLCGHGSQRFVGKFRIIDRQLSAPHDLDSCSPIVSYIACPGSPLVRCARLPRSIPGQRGRRRTCRYVQC